MENSLAILYNSLVETFKIIEENKDSSFGYLKKMVYSNFIEIIKYGEKNNDDFAKKLGRVYQKYGTDIFRDSLIIYVCIVHIHKYLAEHNCKLQNTNISSLTEEEIISDYENVMSLEEFCGETFSIEKSNTNQYEKILSSTKSNESYIIDVDNNLWTFGSKICPFPEKIASDVMQVIVDLSVLIGIDTNGKLWQEKPNNMFPIEKLYFDEVEDVTFTKISKFTNLNKLDNFFALSTKGHIYQFSETAIVGDGIFTIKSTVHNAIAIDFASDESSMVFVSKTKNLYSFGYLDKILSTKNGFRKEIQLIDFNGEAQKVFLFKEMLFVIDLYGHVWSIGANELGCLGTNSKMNSSFKKLKINGKVVDISCGEGHILFVTNKGDVYGCGKNTSGELGCLDELTFEPKIITNIVGKMVSAGRQCTFIVDFFTNLFAIGTNRNGRFGILPSRTDLKDNHEPVTINLLDYMI